VPHKRELKPVATTSQLDGPSDRGSANPIGFGGPLQTSVDLAIRTLHRLANVLVPRAHCCGDTSFLRKFGQLASCLRGAPLAFAAEGTVVSFARVMCLKSANVIFLARLRLSLGQAVFKDSPSYPTMVFTYCSLEVATVPIAFSLCLCVVLPDSVLQSLTCDPDVVFARRRGSLVDNPGRSHSPKIYADCVGKVKSDRS